MKKNKKTKVNEFDKVVESLGSTMTDLFQTMQLQRIEKKLDVLINLLKPSGQITTAAGNAILKSTSTASATPPPTFTTAEGAESENELRELKNKNK